MTSHNVEAMGISTENETGGAVAFAIDALREELGLTVPELAERAEMTPTHLWEIVNTDAPMTPAEAARLCMEMSFVLLSRSTDEELFVA